MLNEYGFRQFVSKKIVIISSELSSFSRSDKSWLHISVTMINKTFDLIFFIYAFDIKTLQSYVYC